MARPLVYFVLCLALELAGLYWFAKGFFPYKQILPGFAQFRPDAPPAPAASFGRLVVMVVDALRYDFVLAPQRSHMPFTQNLIRSGQALAYVARASPPTVTMPCLKALTTGSTPNFLDAVLNIAENDASATLVNQDNLLHQLKHAGQKSLVFYGDDTWLRLFPQTFSRHEGTTSFFVSDTTEVDHNVTRHIHREMEQADWDVLILHYLGLDHIGHLEGPNSPMMAPKQREMDQVVQTIYDRLLVQDRAQLARNPTAKPSLLVVLGDHGMSDAGNHGGNSVRETSPGMVFLSSAFHDQPLSNEPLDLSANALTHYDQTDILPIQGVIRQIDLVPTLSIALGVPIPRNSLGRIIPQFLHRLSLADQLLALRQQADQMIDLVQLMYPDFQTRDEHWVTLDPDCAHIIEVGEISFTKVQCHYSMARHFADQADLPTSSDGSLVPDPAYIMKAHHHYRTLVDYTSESLSHSFSNYHIPSMLVGLGLQFAAAILALALYGIQGGLFTNPSNSALWLPRGLVLAMIVTYVITLFGTSFIEDEQYYWYWWTSTLLGFQVFLLVRRAGVSQKPPVPVGKLALNVIFQMVLWRIAQQWNNAGMQLRDMVDFRTLLLQPDGTALSWGLLVIALLAITGLQWNTVARLPCFAYTGVAAYQVIWVGLLTFVSNWAGPLFWSLYGAIVAVSLAEGSAIRRNAPTPTVPADLIAWTAHMALVVPLLVDRETVSE
ncbi:major facilitator super transporter protein [Dimargaris cristalligena]|nr:major facilitator super transporter protein [Dimargaris cristalligena]